jgi:hypothetical protein
MATEQLPTNVEGVETIEKEQVRRIRSFFKIFWTESWETISTTSMKNDIHVTTDREIETVYVNGVPWKSE